MSPTKIEWCDETVNWFTGCRGGCSYCYARRMAKRLATMPGPGAEAYRRVAKETGDPFSPAVHLDVCSRVVAKLTKTRDRASIRPRSRPRRIFVGSMSDLCFENRALVYEESGKLATLWNTVQLQAATVRFAAILGRHGHTTLWLTKRPELLDIEVAWPKTAHVGVSVTGNNDAHRVGSLIAKFPEPEQRPGVLWASVEPLRDMDFDPTFLENLDWVVVGVQTGALSAMGEVVGLDGCGTGPVEVTRGETLIEAAERIVDWCADNDVPCFVKNNLRRLHHSRRPPMEWPREFPKEVQA